jgi:perosamine synthetase
MGMIKLPKNARQYFDDNYKEVFSTGNLAEGAWNEKIADWACKYTEAPYATAVNSNGAGILSILSVLKSFRNKKKIFIQSNTMYGVKTMAITSGLELIGYVDCSLDYLMPTFEQVEDFIDTLDDPKECVFLITHIGGWVNPDIERIANLCNQSEVTLIEDCAHSLGSTLNEKHTGLFGDAGVYSLYATKAVPAGEGGIIVTNDEDLYDKAQRYSIYDRFDQQLDLGVNNRMSEINALICYSVIKETEAIIENKLSIAKRYINACDQNGWEYIDPFANEQRANLYKFILISRSLDPVEDFKAITLRTSPVYDYYLGNDSSDIKDRHICLPVWYELEEEKILDVISELKIK